MKSNDKKQTSQSVAGLDLFEKLSADFVTLNYSELQFLVIVLFAIT